ncbi:nucleoside/nucleotide kinase family protein [Kineococcus glutinatus]|uniref:nucleoside/nucleotide kinase family protein n=1 Tax=Kineococcus glutinatus TaxID=1070872 RepID=UPI0031EF116D
MTARSPLGVFTGLATLDLVHRVEVPPGPDEKVTAQGQELVAGGPAANAAVTFAALGGRARLVTALGRHPLARAVAEELADHGVEVVDAAPGRTAPPAVSGVRVAGAHRSVTSVNAGGEAVPAPAALAGGALLRGADVLLVDGHHPELALAAARAAREVGVPVLLDGGSWKPVLAELLPLVDVAVCSAAFAVPGGGDVLLDVLAAGAGAAAATAGPGPVRWRTERPGEVRKGSIGVPRLEAVDTLGAGDVLHGALALAIADGMELHEALTAAVQVASWRCTVPGARAWLRAPWFADLPLARPRPGRAAPEGPVDLTLDDLVRRAGRLTRRGGRRLLGIVGAPGAGKSTLAAELVAALERTGGPGTAVRVPMDGFHCANVVLEALGRRDRKGAPDTFDAGGFAALVRRLRAADEEVVLAPEFRREIEEPIGSALPVPRAVPLVVVEGNYLLLREGPWAALEGSFDETWYLDVDDELRVRRLARRHEEFGKPPEQALAWALGSDQANAEVVAATRGRADLVLRWAG